MEPLFHFLQLDHLKPILGPLNSSMRVLVILLLAWIALRLSRKVIRTFRIMMANRAPDVESAKRIDTLARVFRYALSAIITLVAGMLALSELGIAIAPILGAAGVVGIAVGFGAQSLIKDYFNGLFLLLEDQVRTGDVIEAGGKAGQVEEVTLRHIRLRSYEGDVHYIPNSMVTTVTNKSRGYSNAVIDVGVAYRDNTDRAMEIMLRVGDELKASEEFGPKILDGIELAGVQAWADKGVMLRARIRVKPMEQWPVRREFLRRLKFAFDEAGIGIPASQLTVHALEAHITGPDGGFGGPRENEMKVGVI